MSIKRAAVAAILTIACLGAVAAQAQETAAPVTQLACTVPGPPPPQSSRPRGPTPPVKPACTGAAGNFNRCSRKDLDRYNLTVDAFNRDMDAYNRAGQSYTDALRNWIRTVSDYQDCEVDQMNRDIQRINSSH